jgi:hypothetical protein
MWSFICDSDVHYGDHNDSEGIPESRKNSVAKILQINSQKKIDFVLCVGDILNNAADGHKLCGCCVPDSNGNQYQAFIDKYLVPIENGGIGIKLCVGNHDIDKWKYPALSILKLIHDKNGGTYSWFQPDLASCYTFIHKGIQFICMGVYPRNLEWLRNNLPTDKTQPIIFFYHYNTSLTEPFADWWSDEEKDSFHQTISSYNVKLIVNGHCHTSKTSSWRDIPYIICANNPVIVNVSGSGSGSGSQQLSIELT